MVIKIIQKIIIKDLSSQINFIIINIINPKNI